MNALVTVPSPAILIVRAIYDSWREGLDTFDIAGRLEWAWPSLLQRERESRVVEILHRIREERIASGVRQ